MEVSGHHRGQCLCTIVINIISCTPQANLTIYQKGTYYLGIKILNNLTLEIKNVADNQKKFKTALKKFLYTYSFYTLEEYFGQL
jgi:hypothetical protein